MSAPIRSDAKLLTLLRDRIPVLWRGSGICWVTQPMRQEGVITSSEETRLDQIIYDYAPDPGDGEFVSYGYSKTTAQSHIGWIDPLLKRLENGEKL